MERSRSRENLYQTASPSSRAPVRQSVRSGQAEDFVSKIYKPHPVKPAPAGTYRAGDTVKHRTFGTGTVLSATPMANDTLLEIAFDKVGTKKLFANFARLEKA